MHIIDSKEYSSNLEKYDFDDIGCMVLYSKENNIDLNKIDSKVFTIDTKRFVDSKEAYYTIDEKTPMSYGFGAYENQVKNSITFNDMILRMLRGENLTNPKIRKQLLGDKI